MSILDTIKPIKLLRGSHNDTGVTGSGCMMNVISYLQGDSIITDTPFSVCPMVRTVCIKINDTMEDSERQELHKFIFRAMGSATDYSERIRERRHRILWHCNKDIIEMVRRWGYLERNSVIEHIMRCGVPASHAFCVAMELAISVARYLPRKAVYKMRHIMFDVGDTMSAGLQYEIEDYYTRRVQLIKLCLTMLDDLLPDTEVVEPVHEERAIVLVETARSKGTLVTV